MKLFVIAMALIGTLLSAQTIFLDDYDEALIQAKKEHKDVYILITSTACKWCKKFEKITLGDKATIKNLEKNFVILVLTRNLDYIPSQLTAKRVPKHYFLTAEGEVIYSFLGYWNPEDFQSFVSDVEKKKE